MDNWNHLGIVPIVDWTEVAHGFSSGFAISINLPAINFNNQNFTVKAGFEIGNKLISHVFR